MSRPFHRVPALLAWMLLVSALPVPAPAASAADDPLGWWIGAGVGGGSFESATLAPAAGRGGLAGSIELGYRMHRDFGLGVELGAVAPLSGCRDWPCGAATDFAPSFTRVFAFAEYRPGDSGLRLRAGLGMSRFCYQRHWDTNAWSMFDTVMLLIDEDYVQPTGGSGAYRCDAARKTLGGSVSIGYDWRLRDSPLQMGVRLSGEAANYSASPVADLPGFRHRAVILTLHLRLN